MTYCDTKLIQRNTTILMMAGFLTPYHTHMNKRNQNSNRVLKLPMAVQEIGNKRPLFRKVNLYIWTKKKLREIVVE